jgi:hypothetical protein
VSLDFLAKQHVHLDAGLLSPAIRTVAHDPFIWS